MSIYTIFASNPSKTYWSTEPSRSEEEILKQNPAIVHFKAEMRAQVLSELAGDDVPTTPNIGTVDAMTKAAKEWNLRVVKTREAKKVALIEVLAGAQSQTFIEEVRKVAGVSPKELAEILKDGGKAAQTTIDHLMAQYRKNAEIMAARMAKGKRLKSLFDLN